MSASTALLPTGTFINPSDPQNEFFNKDTDTLYIVQDGRKFRALCGGNMGAEWDRGTGLHIIHHDQTGFLLGRYYVIGVIHANEDDGKVVGTIPTRKIPFWVFK